MNFKKYFILVNSSIRAAIIKINKLGGKSLIVVSSGNKLEGVLSSRDLRKAILSGHILDSDISEIYNKKPKFIYSDKIKENIYKLNYILQKLNIMPIVDRNSKKIIDVLDSSNLSKFNKKKLESLKALIVIMAGGKGLRLRPYTSVLPKPLLPINDKPVIEHIIDQFNKYGTNNFVITLNYKTDILKTFFFNLKKKLFNNKFNFIYEKKPLGTAGSLYKIKRTIRKNIVLTNCDTIIKCNYNNLIDYHRNHKNDITIIVSEKKFILPYGVCSKENNKFSFTEKPQIKHNVNTGFYIISKSCLNILKNEKYLDFNEFLKIAIKNKKKIDYYKIKSDQWIDVGQMDTFQNNLNKKL